MWNQSYVGSANHSVQIQLSAQFLFVRLFARSFKDQLAEQSFLSCAKVFPIYTGSWGGTKQTFF